MKRRRERSQPMQVLHLWSWREVVKAVPYLRSVITSVREHYLELLAAQRRLDRDAKHKAPSKRQQLLDAARHAEEGQRAQVKFDDALEEINRVDVYLVDPVEGRALAPFRKEDDLAWYVFDQFAPPGIIGWRYHTDPIEECRPLSLLADAAEGDLAPKPRARVTD